MASFRIDKNLKTDKRPVSPGIKNVDRHSLEKNYKSTVRTLNKDFTVVKRIIQLFIQKGMNFISANAVTPRMLLLNFIQKNARYAEKAIECLRLIETIQESYKKIKKNILKRPRPSEPNEYQERPRKLIVKKTKNDEKIITKDVRRVAPNDELNPDANAEPPRKIPPEFTVHIPQNIYKKFMKKNTEENQSEDGAEKLVKISSTKLRKILNKKVIKEEPSCSNTRPVTRSGGKLDQHIDQMVDGTFEENMVATKMDSLSLESKPKNEAEDSKTKISPNHPTLDPSPSPKSGQSSLGETSKSTKSRSLIPKRRKIISKISKMGKKGLKASSLVLKKSSLDIPPPSCITKISPRFSKIPIE